MRIMRKDEKYIKKIKSRMKEGYKEMKNELLCINKEWEIDDYDEIPF